MKLIFLGSGSAFTVGSGNYQSNMLIEDNARKLLIDCGTDARFALNELDYSYADITDVYISHLHADHVGGLEWLSFTTKFDPACSRPKLFISKRLVHDLWSKVLSGGLSSLQGVMADLSTYFDVQPIEDNGYFIWSHHKIRIIQTIHIMSGYAIIPSYGLLFTADNKNVFITTDTQFAPHQIMDFYQQADIIFHDCETSDRFSGVHAHYSELITLDESIKNKMWLYHYNPGPLPDAKKDGFRGFVQKGQIFNFADQSTLE